MKKFKINKKKPFQINVPKITSSLVRLELKPTQEGLTLIFEDSIDIEKVSNDLIVIIYGVCTMEITCVCAYYEKQKKQLLIFYDEYIQIIKFSDNGLMSSSHIINIPFSNYDGFTIYLDSLALLKNNEIVLISRRIK
jgi:hypothetical protein